MSFDSRSRRPELRRGVGPNGQPSIVITGIGVVSPFGVGRERYWDHISRGISGTRAITQFDVSTYPCRVAAWVPPVSIEDAQALEGDDDQDGRADPKRYSRAALFGVIAAREAWRDAGLRAGERGAGVIIGSGGGGIDIGEKQYEDFFVHGGKHVTPYAIAVGNPAKIVKYRFEPEDIEFLNRLRWWDAPREMIQEMVDRQLFNALDALKAYVAEKGISSFSKNTAENS